MKQQQINRLQKNLKKLRLLLDWKVEAIAHHLNVTRQTYSNIEKMNSKKNGYYKMKECHYKKLIKLLDDDAEKE